MISLFRVACAAGLALAPAALAQTSCNRPVGPDLIIADITSPANYAAASGRDAFSLGIRTTNVGNVPAVYTVQPPGTDQHPVVAQGLFRLQTRNGVMQFEQIGQSWLFHGFFALSQNGPCTTCTPGTTAQLGVGCATSDTALIAGTQSNLGPRWQVNPRTGAHTHIAGPSFSGTIARRLQASAQDLEIEASHFVELLAISPDDATAGNGNNNASYRPCTISADGPEYSMFLQGTTVPEQPAISAWRAADSAVTQSSAQADGLFILSSRATPIPGGWHYEFAVYNMNSDAGAGSFSVPLPDTASLTNVGFHDVDYTDGDGVNNVTRDGADWRATRSTGRLTWETTPFAADPNANALLWGTLYNFRFDSDAPPAPAGLATLALWKTPGTTLAVPAQVPAASSCYANCDGSTQPPVLNVNDFVCFQTRFAAGEAYANCDGSTLPPVLNVNDFVCFSQQFAAGCR